MKSAVLSPKMSSPHSKCFGARDTVFLRVYFSLQQRSLRSHTPFLMLKRPLFFDPEVYFEYLVHSPRSQLLPQSPQTSPRIALPHIQQFRVRTNVHPDVLIGLIDLLCALEILTVVAQVVCEEIEPICLRLWHQASVWAGLEGDLEMEFGAASNWLAVEDRSSYTCGIVWCL